MTTPTSLILDDADRLVLDQYGGDYLSAIQSVLASRFYGDAWVLAKAYERAGSKDLDKAIRDLRDEMGAGGRVVRAVMLVEEAKELLVGVKLAPGTGETVDRLLRRLAATGKELAK